MSFLLLPCEALCFAGERSSKDGGRRCLPSNMPETGLQKEKEAFGYGSTFFLHELNGRLVDDL